MYSPVVSESYWNRLYVKLETQPSVVSDSQTVPFGSVHLITTPSSAELVEYAGGLVTALLKNACQSVEVGLFDPSSDQ